MDTPLAYGDGYRELGLEEDAIREYRNVLPNDPDFARAQAGLLALSNELPPEEQNRLADQNLDRLRVEPLDSELVHDTAMCLHFAGRTAGAYRLLRKFQRKISWLGPDHYGMAGYAARQGSWAEAAWHLILCIRQGGDDHMFFDFDLAPLFELAAQAPFEPTLALAMGHPLLAREFHRLRGKCAEVDGITLRALPAEFRPHLMNDYAANLKVLSPLAEPALAARFQRWRDEVGGRIEANAERAIDRGRDGILNAQIYWAEAAARMGDFFAARHHTVFALARHPEWIGDFERRLVPLGMRYLFEDLDGALSEDSRFCWRLYECVRDPGNQASGFAEFGPRGRETCLVKLLQAGLAPRQGESSTELRLLTEVVCCWPRDPSAFLNAALFAASREKWQEARKILNVAPPSMHHLRLTKPLIRAVVDRRKSDQPAIDRPETFYGQPDIGNLVRRLLPTRIAFLQIQATEFQLSRTVRPQLAPAPAERRELVGSL